MLNSSVNLLETGVVRLRMNPEEAKRVATMLSSASRSRNDSVSEATTELSSRVARGNRVRGAARLAEERLAVGDLVRLSRDRKASASAEGESAS